MWLSRSFEADMMFWYSFKILPDRLKLIWLNLCGSLGQSISFVFSRARVGHFATTPQSDVVGIRSRDLGVMATVSVRQKMPFLCIYNPQITVSPTSSFSATFNGNHVTNHPKPWICPLRQWRKTVPQAVKNREKETKAFLRCKLKHCQCHWPGVLLGSSSFVSWLAEEWFLSLDRAFSTFFPILMRAAML